KRKWPRAHFSSATIQTELVRLSCEKCGRSGQYRKQKLIERYGADIRLPDLRARSHPSFSTALIGPGTRLFCRARARFRPHRRTVAGGQPFPKVGLLAPTLSRRFKVSGSQRVLLLTAHETQWRGRCWS